MGLQEHEIKHLKMLRKGLSECTVLLKSNGDFPIDRAGDIALFGSGVRHTIKGGTGSGEVNSRFFETVEKGFQKSGFHITTSAWLDAYDVVAKEAHDTFVKNIKKKAKAAHMPAIIFGMGAIMPEPDYDIAIDTEGDIAIYVLARTSGEGSDRKPESGDLMLTDTEIRDIHEIKSRYKKFMLVLNVGGPVDLTPVMDIDNILILSQLGVQTGSVLCDIVLGRTTPSGKLATTWTAWEDYPTIGDFAEVNETRYKEGIYVGYRYFDSVGKRASFPFGFGLSYTTFCMEQEAATVDGETVTVSVVVKNTGAYKGKEVVQLYVSVPNGELDQPYQTLACFKKTKELKPNEAEEITMSFHLSDIASYDSKKAAYVLEKGDYLLRVGNSSVDTKCIASVKLAETVVISQLRNALDAPNFEDFVPENRKIEEDLSKIKQLTVDASAFNTSSVEYDKEYEIDDYVKSLTNEQLALLSIGAFKMTGALSSVIGNQGFAVAGAAGESAVPTGTDFKPLAMADGPAGVRISKKYFVDAKGVVHPIGGTLPETFIDYMPAAATKLTQLTAKKPKSKEDIKTQYATAIPIGTAIAQSFNTEFAYMCGDIVGTEMAMYGVQLWLAPALNIHRNILCGRNFEYYSEDPLVSGKMAAAITNGVQKHKGCGTTIKHFAANNQETNRYFNNSQVSERAMREIYLKGFEICVKESQPKSVMTSYNLINGVHTSERRDLIDSILRCEFGFKGIVMTDWVIEGSKKENGAIYDSPQAYKVVGTGGELFMPGCRSDYKNVLEALKDGRLPREQVEINVTRLYKMVKELHGE